MYTIQDFKRNAESEKVNTCNGWGFAGKYGNRFTIDADGTSFRFDDCKWSYRHNGPTAHKTYWINNDEVPHDYFLTAIALVLTPKKTENEDK